MRVFDTALYSREELDRISELIGFDAGHYRTAYPDIADAEIDPLRHFLDQGVLELRLPGPLTEPPGSGRPASRSRGLAGIIGFDPSFYADSYPHAATDPLRHFVETGIRERRLPFALETNSAAERLLWRILDRHGIAHQGSLEGQSQYDRAAWRGVADEVLMAGRRCGLLSRTYRNNFWLGLGIGLLAEKQFGLAACCYNFFFHHYIPLALLGNGAAGVVGTARLHPTREELKAEGGRRVRGRKAGLPETVAVGEPQFLNRAGVAAPPVNIALPVPVFGTLSDVELVGGTSLILHAGHDVLYDYLDQSSDRRREPQCPNLIHVVGDACAVHWPAQRLDVDEAFSLLHDHSHNYHHWLLEVLPRYLFARRQGLDPRVPLLVESRLAPQKRELLGVVFDGDAPLIELPEDAAARVRTLYWASDLCRNSVHTERPPSKADILFSPDAVAMLREVAAPYLTQAGSPSGGYERVLVARRDVAFRRLVNHGMLEAASLDFGFWNFDPKAATWIDQVRVFSNARLIVAEAGAALANIVFCRPGATIVVLVNGHRHSNYFYLTQLADLVAVRLYFYECLRLDGSHTIGVQDDMIVPITNFISHLQRFLDIPDPIQPARIPSRSRFQNGESGK